MINDYEYHDLDEHWNVQEYINLEQEMRNSTEQNYVPEFLRPGGVSPRFNGRYWYVPARVYRELEQWLRDQSTENWDEEVELPVQNNSNRAPAAETSNNSSMKNVMKNPIDDDKEVHIIFLNLYFIYM